MRITGMTAFALLAYAGHACAEKPDESNVPKGSIAAKHGRLRVEGNRIVDKNGRPVAPHGMSLFWSTVIKPYHEAVIPIIRAHDPDSPSRSGTLLRKEL